MPPNKTNNMKASPQPIPRTEEFHADPPTGRVSREEFLTLFVAVFLPMFMAAVDQTLLATATPAIAESLGGLRDTSWIAVAYLLTAAVVVPLYGRLGDTFGRRNVLLAALGLFALGSLACGLAQSLPQLVAARVLQGLGGGGLMTLCQALIGELVVPRERVRFQGYFAIVFTSASVGGPVLGGLLVSYLDWRWLFFANLPLAAIAAWRLLRLPVGDRQSGPSGARDIPGILLFAVGMLSAMFWLTSVGHRFSWGSVWSLVLAASSVTAFAALVWHERRQDAPFFPFDLLQRPPIAFSLITTSLFAACMFAMVFFLPIYLQLGHRISPLMSGLLLLPLTAGIVIGSTTTARWVARTGEPRIVPVIGMSLASLGLLLLGLLPSHPAIVGALGILTGIGLGTVMPVNMMVVQTVAGRAKLGVVTSMVSLFRSAGAALGAALFGALVYALMPDVDLRALARSGSDAERLEITHAFHVAYMMAACVAAMAAFSASRVPRIRLWSGADGADPDAPHPAER
jgi:EmrB/QacA subfamily drug resistance transporter